MPEFSFAFSYDMRSRVAWLTLHGVLDQAGAQRLQGVVRAVFGGLTPQEMLVDVREMTLPDGRCVDRLVRAGAIDRSDCDVVLVTQDTTPGHRRAPAASLRPAVA